MSKATATNPARGRWVPTQYLRAQDLSDEQAYHIAMRRRHNATQHVWGIVHGLDITQVDTALFVQPGIAVDGFGREIVVAVTTELPAHQFDTFETDFLEVWLSYDRSEGSPAPVGYVGRTCDADRPASRWREGARVDLRRPTSPPIDPRHPIEVAGGVEPWKISPPDDPRVTWPVYLGRIERLHEAVEGRWYTVDPSRRPYVGVVAASVRHPSGDVALDLGATANGQAGFAVVDERPDPPVTLLEMSSDGVLRAHGPVQVDGDVVIARGALEFGAGQPPGAAPDVPSIYRVRGDAGSDVLRIDLGRLGMGAPSLVVGFTAPDGSFQPCLEVKVGTGEGTDLHAEVVVHGDLDVKGQLKSKEPQLQLSEDAKRAIQGGFMSALAAAME